MMWPWRGHTFGEVGLEQPSSRGKSLRLAQTPISLLGNISVQITIYANLCYIVLQHLVAMKKRSFHVVVIHPYVHAAVLRPSLWLGAYLELIAFDASRNPSLPDAMLR